MTGVAAEKGGVDGAEVGKVAHLETQCTAVEVNALIELGHGQEHVTESAWIGHELHPERRCELKVVVLAVEHLERGPGRVLEADELDDATRARFARVDALDRRTGGLHRVDQDLEVVLPGNLPADISQTLVVETRARRAATFFRRP